MIFNKYGNIAENENIIIRKLKSKDFVFFKDWYISDHVKIELKNTISDKEVKSMISVEEKYYLILIIENKNKPVGIIKIVEDKSLIIKDNKYNKPFYYFILIFYEEISDYEKNKIIKLFINSYKIFKLKSGALFTLIDKAKNDMQNEYFVNDFKIIDKDYYKTELIETLNNRDDENHYDKLIMYIKNI